jgi:hypothetical protein
MTIQLEPVRLPGGLTSEEFEEQERLRREAEAATAAAAATVTNALEPIDLPAPPPLPEQSSPQAAEAAAVGDAYRAAGAQPGPHTERTHPVTNPRRRADAARARAQLRRPRDFAAGREHSHSHYAAACGTFYGWRRSCAGDAPACAFARRDGQAGEAAPA